MANSRHVFYRVLSFGLVGVLSACSSVNPSVEPGLNPDLELANCLEAEVQGPSSVVEGESLSAQLNIKNVCNESIDIPIADATAIRDNEDTGVEISFHLMITDPSENQNGVYSNIRWEWIEPNSLYVDTQTFVTLAPNQEIKRNFTWDGQLEYGDVLPAGDYVLFGHYYYTPNGGDSKDFAVVRAERNFKIVPK